MYTPQIGARQSNLRRPDAGEAGGRTAGRDWGHGYARTKIDAAGCHPPEPLSGLT